jgi:hypothetical protein
LPRVSGIGFSIFLSHATARSPMRRAEMTRIIIMRHFPARSLADSWIAQIHRSIDRSCNVGS